jgi:DNA-binding NarL/FixJ family response regulator
MVEDIVERKRSEPLASLSPREISVLELVALERKNLTIAQDLGISVGTVKINATRLFEKLRVPDRTEAAYRAAELVLLSSEEP